MQYRLLFSLKIRHDYYLSNECPDFTVKPTAECEQHLRNHRLHLKKTFAGLQVYAAVDNITHTPLLPLSNGLTFSFLLYLTNPAFVQFTDFPASYGGQSIRNPVFVNPPQQPEPEAVTDNFKKSKPDEIIKGVPSASDKYKFILSRKKHGSGKDDFTFNTAVVKNILSFLPAENAVVILPGNIVEEAFSLTYPAVVDVKALQVKALEAFQTDEFELSEGKVMEEGQLLFPLKNNPGENVQLENFQPSPVNAVQISAFQRNENTVLIKAGEQPADRFKIAYPVRAEHPWGSFGRVDITVHERDAFTDFTAAKDPDNNFEIQFRAKKFYWKYWLIPEMAMTMSSISFGNGEVVQTPASANNNVLIHQFKLLGPTEIPIKFYGKSLGVVSSDRNLLSAASFENTIKGFRGSPSDDLPMEDDAYDRFYQDIVTVEQKIGLTDHLRIYLFSDHKIPCREKYGQYPRMIVTGPDNYSANFYLMPPPLGTDRLNVVRISKAFK